MKLRHEDSLMNESFIDIDLHGMRTEEAEKAVEKAVASAGPGTYQIRVIHGGSPCLF